MDKAIELLRKNKVSAAVGGAGLLAFSIFTAVYDRCPAAGAITETLVTVIAAQAECGNYDEMVSDISGVVDDLDFCGDFDQKIYADKVPGGEWTALGAGCFVIMPKVAEKFLEEKLPADWGCKTDTLEYARLTEACERLGKDQPKYETEPDPMQSEGPAPQPATGTITVPNESSGKVSDAIPDDGSTKVITLEAKIVAPPEPEPTAEPQGPPPAPTEEKSPTAPADATEVKTL